MEFDALGFGVCILIMFGYLMYVLVKPEKF